MSNFSAEAKGRMTRRRRALRRRDNRSMLGCLGSWSRALGLVFCWGEANGRTVGPKVALGNGGVSVVKSLA